MIYNNKNWCSTILGISARCLQKALLILMNNYSWSLTKSFFCAWNANLFSSLLMAPLSCARDFVGFARDHFCDSLICKHCFCRYFTLLLMAALFQIFAVLKKFASVYPFATVTRTWLKQKRLRGELENNGARAKIKENLVQPSRTDAF